MATVEVMDDKEAISPLFTADFDFLPRIGEYIARDTEGYFNYYNVVEVWHRLDIGKDRAIACVLVQLDD